MLAATKIISVLLLTCIFLSGNIKPNYPTAHNYEVDSTLKKIFNQLNRIAQMTSPSQINDEKRNPIREDIIVTASIDDDYNNKFGFTECKTSTYKDTLFIHVTHSFWEWDSLTIKIFDDKFLPVYTEEVEELPIIWKVEYAKMKLSDYPNKWNKKLFGGIIDFKFVNGKDSANFTGWFIPN